MRQHATGPIDINNIRWTPFLGVNTLLVRANAHNNDNGNNYNPVMLFRNVNYNPQQHPITITAHDNGQQYQLERLRFNHNNVLLRCECGDFYWRFNYYDHIDRSLWGRVRAPYHALYDPGSANPMQLPGACKHLMKLAQTIQAAGQAT